MSAARKARSRNSRISGSHTALSQSCGHAGIARYPPSANASAATAAAVRRSPSSRISPNRKHAPRKCVITYQIS